MVNPWIWYILNDEMPDIDFDGFLWKKLLIWLLVAVVLSVGFFCIMKYAVGFSNENFAFWFLPTYFVYLAILIFLTVKIFK